MPSVNICFETFGCRLNRAEALEDRARCLARGHRIVTSHQEADLFVIRGCSVTASAQHDSERLIDRLRRHYPFKRILVTGCLAGAKPFRISSRDECEDRFIVPTETSRGYLKVQDGCDSRCAFCIIPSLRGAARSEDFTALMDRARRFIDAGYHELVVTGCNLTQYRSGDRRLPELLAALAELDPKGCRIRLGSVEPGPVADDTVRAMGEHANVCRFLHLAVQSGSDPVLVSMHRPYRAHDVAATVKLARELMPKIALGCDMIGGFPGEERLDHERSRLFIEQQKFVNVHAFPYSNRPGTVAARRTDQLDDEVCRERAHQLSAIGEKNRERFAETFVKHRVQVVVERTSRHGGWTGEYLWIELPSERLVNFHRDEKLRRQLVTMRVRKAYGGRLYGVPEAEP